MVKLDSSLVERRNFGCHSCSIGYYVSSIMLQAMPIFIELVWRIFGEFVLEMFSSIMAKTFPTKTY